MNKIQEPHEEYGGLSTQLSSRFISDTFKYSPATLIPAVMALISSIVFTRMFTTIEFGIYSSILAITSPTVTILTEWLGQSTGRFYAEYKQKGQLYLYQSAISKCLQTIFLFSFIISISLLILGTLDVFEFWLFEIPLLIGLISVVLTQIIQTITIRILPVSFKIFAYRNTLVGVSILTFLFSLGLSYFLGPKAQYLLYGSSLSVAIFIPYLLLKSDLWQHTKTISTLEPEAIPLIGRFAKYGIPITMWFFASQLLRVSDRFIILYFLGPSAVGEYSANYSLVTQASELLTGPLLAAAVPILYEQWAHRNIATTRKTLADMTDIHLLVGFALFGGFATVGQQFATLLIGENFHAGAIILMPVLAGSLIWGASMYGHKSMEMTERPSIMIINIFVAAAINFIL
ncbi:MAG: lipopolysaccharide biosynthesis protein, partial [Anaerolineaceae bacterium]|nr:lipopolysaccharide biosynthesis protein [Anaerolineaceae bacterium]